MNDNEVMSLAEKVLPEHNMEAVFSYRYTFLLGYRVSERDIVSKFNILESRARIAANELKELLSCQKSQSQRLEEE